MDIINFFFSNLFTTQKPMENFDRKRLAKFIEWKNILIANKTLIGTIRGRLKWFFAVGAMGIVLFVQINSEFEDQLVSVF